MSKQTESSAQSERPSIFYCDHREDEIKLFKEQHGSCFDIEAFTDPKDFGTHLRQRHEAGDDPNIILIDLFHPKNSARREEAETQVTKAKALLRAQIEEARESVESVMSPIGMELLAIAHQICPDTPAAIYTRFGSSLMRREQLATFSELGGIWLIRRNNSQDHLFYERNKLNQMACALPEKRKRDAEKRERAAERESYKRAARRKRTAILVGITCTTLAFAITAPMIASWCGWVISDMVIGLIVSIPSISASLGSYWITRE